MKLVVDTNVLFSFFWEGSVTKKLIMKQGLELFSPEHALEEINRHEKEIHRKTDITKKRFTELRRELAVAVLFVPLEEYEKRLKRAVKISPDTNDVDFFALSLQLRLPIWSNDTTLKDQDIVRVLSTSDLLNNPGFADIVYPLD